MKLTKRAAEKLQQVAEDAISYVGFANYYDRECHAKREIRRNFKLAAEGRTREIEFKDEDDQ